MKVNHHKRLRIMHSHSSSFSATFPEYVSGELALNLAVLRYTYRQLGRLEKQLHQNKRIDMQDYEHRFRDAATATRQVVLLHGLIDGTVYVN